MLYQQEVAHMPYDKSLIAHKLQRWDQYITDYHLPQWESIPDFGL